MNTSNSSPLERIPEKVERSVDDPATQQQQSRDLKEPQKKASGELAAANALRSLVTSPKKGDDDEEQAEDPAEEFVLPEIYTRSGRKKAIPFPLKLMKVLACKEYSDIVTWLPNGKSFSIIRPKAFTTEILPVHFKTAKYSSFTRKLHRWGFQRHLRGDEAGAFFHKHFVRNRVDLVDKMTCHKPKPSRFTDESASPVRSPGRGMAQHLAMPRLGGSGSRNASSIDAPQSDRRQVDSQQENNELNEAIELEVTRRLRERIAAASLSRQALAVMQQQVQQPMMDPLAMQLNAAALNQHQLAGASGLGSSGLGAAGLNTMLNPGMGHLNTAAAGLSPNPRFGGTSLSAAQALREAQEQCLLLGVPPQQSQGLDLLPNANLNNAKGA